MHCGSFFGIVEPVDPFSEVQCYDIINKGDFSCCSPLAWAPHNGDGLVNILLQREEINPDKPNNYDYTPLAEMILVWKEVNPDSSNNDGRRPLGPGPGQKLQCIHHPPPA